MAARLSIAKWDEADRPREKMAALGSMALSPAELLAILIGSGSSDENAVTLMRRILNDCNNNLNTLGKKTIDQLCAYKGIGPAKAITILAACALGYRCVKTEAEVRPQLNSSHLIYTHFLPYLHHLQNEEFWLVLLNRNLREVKTCRIGQGGLDLSIVDVRLVMREILINHATAYAVCHNHPSGAVQPSQYDDKVTEQLRKASDLLNVKLLDHLIIGNENYYSYADEGRL
ncbi:MAG: DNA repair protein RadC [Bacteroidaceae bacterium]